MFSKQPIKSFAWICFLLMTPILLPGCSQQKEYGIVTGRVTIKGKPMTTGRIEFSSPEKDLSISADIEKNGAYVAKTYDTKGLPPGEYRVAIHNTSMCTGNESLMNESNVQIPAFVPKKYQNSETSELTATVQKGENKPFDFDLK